MRVHRLPQLLPLKIYNPQLPLGGIQIKSILKYCEYSTRTSPASQSPPRFYPSSYIDTINSRESPDKISVSIWL